MGSIIVAECECGFETEDMYLGGGRANHTKLCRFPNYCKDCKSLFVGNMYDKEIICDKCSSNKTIPYNDLQLIKEMKNTAFDWYKPEIVKKYNNTATGYIDGQLVLSSGNNLCPKCSNHKLEFISIGMWD